jgi:hypothetical protein
MFGEIIAMFGIDVSPKRMEYKPLVTDSETALGGSLPPPLGLLLHSVVVPFGVTSANLNCPVPLKFVFPTTARPW